MSNKPNALTIETSIVVGEYLANNHTPEQLIEMIGAVACWPDYYPEVIGFEIIGKPVMTATKTPGAFHMIVEVKVQNEDAVIEWAICRILSRGYEPPEEPYEIDDALFDIMFTHGGGPEPEEMSFTYTMVK